MSDTVYHPALRIIAVGTIHNGEVTITQVDLVAVGRARYECGQEFEACETPAEQCGYVVAEAAQITREIDAVLADLTGEGEVRS